MNKIPDYLSLINDLIYEELIKVDGTLDTQVMEYVLNIQYAGVKIESFFNYASIVRIAHEVFSETHRRDFILGLVQRLALRLDESDVNQLIDIITSSYKHYSTSLLIPHPVREALLVDVDEIRNNLSNNFWLLTYYLIVLSKGNLNELCSHSDKQTSSTKTNG